MFYGKKKKKSFHRETFSRQKFSVACIIKCLPSKKSSYIFEKPCSVPLSTTTTREISSVRHQPRNLIQEKLEGRWQYAGAEEERENWPDGFPRRDKFFREQVGAKCGKPGSIQRTREGRVGEGLQRRPHSMLCRWERANGYWHTVLMDRPPLFLLAANAKYASLAIRRRFAMIGNALTNRKTGRKRYCVSYEPWFDGWSISGSTDVSFLLGRGATIFSKGTLSIVFFNFIYIYIYIYIYI